MPRVVATTGYQQFLSSALTGSVALSTSLLTNVTTGVIANAAIFSVGGSSGAIRFRDDGVAPTSNIGMRLPANSHPYLYQGDLHRIRLIADSAAGNADLNVTYVQVASD